MDEGGHRNGLDGQKGRRQQLLHPAEPGGQSGQQGPGCYSQQEARGDTYQGIPDSAPKFRRRGQFCQPCEHTEGETRMMRWLMTMAPDCQRNSQKITAQARMVRRPFIEVSG